MKVKIAQSCLTLCDPMDWGLPGSSVHGILQARILEWVAVPFSRGSSQPRDQTQVSHITGRFPFSRGSSQPRDWTQVSGIAGGFLLSESPGKPMNTGVGSLFLLQGIFLTQGLNQGLLNCRRTLYQMGYEGIPSWPRNTQRNKRPYLISYACMCIGAH